MRRRSAPCCCAGCRRGTTVPPLPVVAAVPPPPSDSPADAATDRPAPLPRQPALEAALAARLQRGGPQSALRLIDTTRGVAPAYAALLRGEVVRSLFIRNDDAEALHVARLAATAYAART